MIDHQLASLDRTIARMRGIQDAGRWPSGDPLDRFDRELVAWNLQLAIEQRKTLRLALWRREGVRP